MQSIVSEAILARHLGAKPGIVKQIRSCRGGAHDTSCNQTACI